MKKQILFICMLSALTAPLMAAGKGRVQFQVDGKLGCLYRKQRGSDERYVWVPDDSRDLCYSLQVDKGRWKIITGFSPQILGEGYQPVLKNPQLAFSCHNKPVLGVLGLGTGAMAIERYIEMQARQRALDIALSRRRVTRHQLSYLRKRRNAARNWMIGSGATSALSLLLAAIVVRGGWHGGDLKPVPKV